MTHPVTGSEWNTSAYHVVKKMPIVVTHSGSVCWMNRDYFSQGPSDMRHLLTVKVSEMLRHALIPVHGQVRHFRSDDNTWSYLVSDKCCLYNQHYVWLLRLSAECEWSALALWSCKFLVRLCQCACWSSVSMCDCWMCVCVCVDM